MLSLTDEQKAIINHPVGNHARVLAVAGSGKTSTMVQRIVHLVKEQKVNPRSIRVVMFNKLARLDFERQLAVAISETDQRPSVMTFHALASSVFNFADRTGIAPKPEILWEEDKQELALITMHRAIESLIQEGQIEAGVDPQEALTAVGQWKASLIPPERAGHRSNPELPLIYRRFEALRIRDKAYTFDDFVPYAIALANSHPDLQKSFTNRIDHLIVDEYQDINYGQQQLIRLIAGTRADVMVVGDDDQTIYEWRAARPHYILRGFQQDFDNKPVLDYNLSHSFRFGPLIAQTAYNTIRHNKERASKPLVAHFVEKTTNITILRDESEQATQTAMAMGQEVATLVMQKHVSPQRIAVLGRTFSQMEGLQTVFLKHKIPFRVLGRSPFFDRDENRTLCDYVRLALALDKPANQMRPWRVYVGDIDEDDGRTNRATKLEPHQEAVRTVLSIANTPNRKLPRTALGPVIERQCQQGATFREAFAPLLDPFKSPLLAERREVLQELLDFLLRIRERVEAEVKLSAGDLLEWIVEHTGYFAHFERYYGGKEASIERIASVRNFLRFAKDTELTTQPFLDYLLKLDPTQGQPSDNVVLMTTVYRTKGLEYDYVFLPNCVDGTMPLLVADRNDIYDIAGLVPDQAPSPAVESERRLFYVAMTRAKEHLFIGTSLPPSMGLQEGSTDVLPSRFLEEIELEPTRELISMVQTGITEKESGRTIPWEKIIHLFRVSTCTTSIRKSVANNYLAALDHVNVVDQIKNLLDTAPEAPFQYRYKYASVEAMPASPTRNVEPEAPDNPWANIGITI